MTADVEARRAELEAIAAEVRGCTRCRLHEGRRNAVPGEGSPDTEVLFVGEGPGQHEDEQGRPFVGAAGGLLTELLRSIGWRRDDVFITNVVKCRPPGNRDPEPDEIAACAPFLRRQLAALDPALVVTLGRISLGTFMPGTRIGGVHGTNRPIDPELVPSPAQAFALYHPAAAFRQQALRTTLFEDMAHLPDLLVDQRTRRAQTPLAPVAPEAAVAGPVDPAASVASEAHEVAAGPEAAAEPEASEASARSDIDDALATSEAPQIEMRLF